MSDPAFVLEQYEALRREAVGLRSSGQPGQGMAVLLHRGIAGWLAVLGSFAPGPRPESLAVERSGAELLRWTPSVRRELTTVLAGMVMSCAGHREEVPCRRSTR